MLIIFEGVFPFSFALSSFLYSSAELGLVQKSISNLFRFPLRFWTPHFLFRTTHFIVWTSHVGCMDPTLKLNSALCMGKLINLLAVHGRPKTPKNTSFWGSSSPQGSHYILGDTTRPGHVTCPSLIQIGSKTAEKNSAQTNRQTDTTKIMVTWP